MNSQESSNQSKCYLNSVGDIGVNLGIKLDNHPQIESVPVTILGYTRCL